MNIYHLDDIPDDLKKYFMPAPQLGLEPTPEEYVENMVKVFRRVRDWLKPDGTIWVNLGDSYNTTMGTTSYKGPMNEHGSASLRLRKGWTCPSLKPKDLVGIPWRVAFALQADGWYLRSDIIWHKPNPMPERVTDRPTKSHEYIFLMSKSQNYYYDADAIREPCNGSLEGHEHYRPKYAERQRTGERFEGNGKHGNKAFQVLPEAGRNKRSVWTVTTKPYKEAHFATFPPDLITPCILAGSKPGDTVLDPFGGAGTTAWVAKEHGRKAVTCELNSEYCDLIVNRLRQGVLF